MDDGQPRHVAFIMDGNGRWAEARGLPRALGHRAGAETVRRVTSFARRRGIPFLTLYAFSTENWSRPREEVDALMELLSSFLAAELPALLENGVRLKILGDRTGLSEGLRQRLAAGEERTVGLTGLTLSLAINYGGRDECLRAARLAAERLAALGRGMESLDQEFFAACLDTAGMPDPDLIIRTAGEMRLSNFLIWQAAYAELFFTRRTWPDFSDADFEEAILEYGKRARKFGGA
ncbi:MAG: di-trans,poly-cis-decaprenylcistransferase [Planctomycetota bacterium]|nr:di-trans,poly-cis-decaprenylcistransferase [Planctomycetota bacterium]